MITEPSHKGEVFAASDQSQTWRNPAEQTTLPWRSGQLFFINMKNSNTSSRPKVTLLPQQKPGRNAGRKLPTLLMRKFLRLYNINSSDNINGQHSDHSISLYYGTDISGRALPLCPSFRSDIGQLKILLFCTLAAILSQDILIETFCFLTQVLKLEVIYLLYM